MSKVIRSFRPSSAPRPTHPTTPPAGPEKNVFTGTRLTAAGVTAPPFDCITRGATFTPRSATPRSKRSR
jgi:hypothetical protein